ncbi:hypothetical protein CRG98_040754 [Punica granatum]|uniref:Uncharacterized protein n=1 Tax=Punica granatum TaxID=22663 RepID=A0A2I0I4E4_PUNGR|nr:hypothetical protein CRG98_040754 [Punica granatum]
MFYLASGYEERVGEVFESPVTRLNAWKRARVLRMHVRARKAARKDVWRAGRARWCAIGRRARGPVAVRGYYSLESTVFARNEEINLK